MVTAASLGPIECNISHVSKIAELLSASRKESHWVHTTNVKDTNRIIYTRNWVTVPIVSNLHNQSLTAPAVG